ncbi:RNA-binding protein 26-like [Anneissia japonica]|uniref:RNA-binding protein 26-like n=1 Tax=Anneissia japonica TaxID=1529436 RepID=UPI00142591B6|nr:RNA-binding protein 26-like [Anneissia japonica]
MSKGRGRDDYRNQDQSANNQHMDSPDHLSNMPSAISVVTSIGSGSGNNRPQSRGGFRGRGRNRGAQRGNNRSNHDRLLHQNLKPRCRDYDEKGFCMRGELCPYDHGNDPVIVDDLNLPNMLSIGSPSIPPPPLPSQPPPQQPPPPQIPPQIPPHPPLGLPRQPLGLPPPRIPPPPGPMLRPLPGVPPDLHRFPPPNLPVGPPPNMRSGPGIPPLATHPGIMRLPPPQIPQPATQREQYEPDGYNPEDPGLDSGQKKPGYVARSRELIGVQTVPMATPKELEELENRLDTTPSPPVNHSNTRTVIDTHSSDTSQQTQSTRQVIQTIPDNRKRTFNESDLANKNRLEQQSENRTVQDVKSRLGWKKPRFTNRDNSCLVIRKVPRNLNTISKLSQHFEKFGTIVNLQVAFDGDPTAALITFATSAQARSAIGCTEAVLNNRFIKVYWHNKEDSQDGNTSGDSSKEANKSSVRERIIIPSKDQLSINKKKPDNTEKTIVKKSGINLSKTLYNPNAVQSSQNQAALKLAQAKQELASAKEAVRLRKQKEAMEKRNSIARQKQQLLTKQIQEQKLLIQKLEKGKGLSTEVKSSILESMKALNKQIDKTKSEIVSKPKTASSTQKELLDTELELYNQQAEGGDTSQLKKRVAQLKLEARSLGLLSSGRGRGSIMKGRGRGRGSYKRGRGNHHKTNTILDKRPRELIVSGFLESDKDEVITHFAAYGELEKIEYNNANNSLIIGYQTRMEAELAASKGQQFKDTILKMAWHKPAPEVVIMNEDDNDNSLANTRQPDDEDNEVLNDDLLIGDDEEDEEDDEESRGWRR